MEQGKYNRKENRICPTKKVEAILKNSRLRFSCYWLEVANISISGIGIKYEGLGILPLSMDDNVDMTLDVASKVFERPIHLKARIVHLTQSSDNENILLLGLEVLEVEQRHRQAWVDGLQRMQDSLK